ncbi:Uma2 family endonuclease [Microcoleus sp. N9_B2]|uniref:Uma2 family endonuclease n=1 Tax=unclassified Microcoleus TaxID=2642155 RepID=UPI002FD2114F
MLTISTPPEQRVLLPNISWQLYESLLGELGNKRSTRIAYHQGQLEIMVPLPEHENRNRLIDRLIVTLIEELNLEYNPFGSMTIKKRKKADGKEPDSCYYIQNEALVRGRTELDFAQDPPPDLALEIYFTSSSLNQFDLYADLYQKFGGTTDEASSFINCKMANMPSAIFPGLSQYYRLQKLTNLSIALKPQAQPQQCENSGNG